MTQPSTPFPLISQILAGNYTPPASATPSSPNVSAPTTPTYATPNVYPAQPVPLTPADAVLQLGQQVLDPTTLVRELRASMGTGGGGQPAAPAGRTQWDDIVDRITRGATPTYDSAHGVDPARLNRFGTKEEYGTSGVEGYTPIQTSGHTADQLAAAEEAYKKLPMHSPYREMAFQNGELQPTGAVKRKTGDSIASAANDPVLHPGGIVGPELSGFGNEAAATVRDIASMPISALESLHVLPKGSAKSNAETARTEHQVAAQNGKVGAALGDIAVAAPLAFGGAELGGALGAGAGAARLAGMAIAGGGLPGAGEATDASIDANETGTQTARNALIGGATGSALGAITGGEGGALARTAFEHLPASVRASLEERAFGSPALRQQIADAEDRLAGATTDAARERAGAELADLKRNLPAPGALGTALSSPTAANILGGAAIMPAASAVGEEAEHLADPNAFQSPDLSPTGLLERMLMGGVNGAIHRGGAPITDRVEPSYQFPQPPEPPAAPAAPAAPTGPDMPSFPSAPAAPQIDLNASPAVRASQVSDLITQAVNRQPESPLAQTVASILRGAEPQGDNMPSFPPARPAPGIDLSASPGVRAAQISDIIGRAGETAPASELNAASILRGAADRRMTGGSVEDVLNGARRAQETPEAPAEPVSETPVSDLQPSEFRPVDTRTPEETAQAHVNEIAAGVPDADLETARTQVAARRDMYQQALENVQKRDFGAIPAELKHMSMNDISTALNSARMLDRALNARAHRMKLPENADEPGMKNLTPEQTADLMGPSATRTRPVEMPATVSTPAERARIMTQVSERYPAIEQRVRNIMVRGGIPESEMRPNRPFAGLPASAVAKLAESRNADVKHVAQIEQVARAMTNKQSVKDRAYLRQVVRQLGMVSRKTLDETEQAGRKQGALPFDQAAGVAASTEAYNRELAETLGTPAEEPRDILTEDC